MLLHDIVLVVVRQRPHQAKVTNLHSVSRGQQDVPADRVVMLTFSWKS